MLGFTHGIIGIVISCTLTAFGGGIVRPVLTSMITKCAPRSEQGAVLGISQSLMSFAQVIAPIASGVLIDHSMLIVWSLLAGVLCLVGLAFSVRVGELVKA
jgi:MFS family permease